MAFSNRFSLEALDEFYEGVYAACEKYGVDLVGGDTSSSQKGFIISITAIGEVTPDKFVQRSTAQKEATCYAAAETWEQPTSDLFFWKGKKRFFWKILNVRPDLEGEKYVIGRILKPEAAKKTIEFFEQEEITPTSMMDISDGLSSEILHICKQSNLGCVLYEEKIPIAEETRNAAYKFELDPTACALSGGEDYELLFTIRPEDYEKLVLNENISVIGYMTDPEEGNKILTKGGNKFDITAQGWNAFKK